MIIITVHKINQRTVWWSIQCREHIFISIIKLCIIKHYFVILYNTPKIEYRNVDKTEISGRIYLNKKCKIYATKSDIFNLETPNGTYKFKSKFNDLINWINAIKDCIKKYGKEE